MHPKSKSPLETKYERLRGMCSRAWENERYIPIDNGIQRSTAGMAVAENGRAWRYMVGAVCISVHRQHGGRAARYTCVRYANTVYNRHHQSFATPGCVYRVRVRACVILLYYYNIIILLYLYIPNIPNISSIPSIPNISNNGNIAL